jgi:hypothetical protein
MKRVVVSILVLTLCIAVDYPIYAAPRTVLCEMFTSTTCPPCAGANQYFDQWLSTYGTADKVAVIKYHVWWPTPGNDPYYLANSGHSQSRVSYYAINYAPDMFINGTQQGSSPSVWPGVIGNYLTVVSPFEITVTGTLSASTGGNIAVNVRSDGTAMSGSSYVLHTVMTESNLIYTGPNGDPKHENVMRMMYPSASGEAFTIALNETKLFTRTIAFNSAWVIPNLEIVVFVQNTTTKEIVQAAKIPIRNLVDITNLAPKTKILDPINGSAMLALDAVTAQWKGIRVELRGKDDNTNGYVTNFGCSVDNGTIKWGIDSIFYLTVADFPAPEGNYKIHGFSKNNRNIVDTVGDSVVVTVYRASMSKKLLFVDETNETKPPFSALGVTDGTVDNYYSSVFTPNDQWDYQSQGLPLPQTLGQYKAIVWCGDDSPTFGAHVVGGTSNTDVLKQYLAVGGKLIISGWRTMRSFVWGNPLPYDLPSGSFSKTYLGIDQMDETSATSDCIGVGGLVSMDVETLKLNTTPYNGKLNCVGLVTAGSKVETLMTYKGGSTYQGKVCGVLYRGSSFTTATLGVPLYFFNENGSKAFIQLLFNKMSIPLTVEEQEEIVRTFRLKQNYPNPFNPTTTIEFGLSASSYVTLSVFDMLGREVARVTDGFLESGTHKVTFNAGTLPTGVYLCRLNAGPYTEMRRMMLVK